MKIPSPRQCGLPPKFDTWRPNQVGALESLSTTTKRVSGLCAPTGFGKSAVYIALALLQSKRTCIVTNSRGLQDQLMRDFSSSGLVDLRGKANYPCQMRDDWTCEDGAAGFCVYQDSGCPYRAAEQRANNSQLVVTNYSKWVSGDRTTGDFDQVVFDEGHQAPEAVGDAMSVTLHHHEIEEELEIPFPRRGTEDFSVWRTWSAGARHDAEQCLKEMQSKVSAADSPKKTWIKSITHLKHLLTRLDILSRAKVDNWIVAPIESGYKFDPIQVVQYAERILFRNIKRVVLVSATLRPKTIHMLGQAKNTFGFYEFPSDFDPRDCPIYWIPTMRVDSKAATLSPLWVRLDQIAARRRDRKGIIHTVSYARQGEILSVSRFAPTMIVNPKGDPSTNTVHKFKDSAAGSILVSPSVSSGYDFPGSQCEWQLLCKIPFPDSRDRIIKARQEVDPDYGPYLAIQSMVQAFGRGARYQGDRCENFIADDHISWFLPRYGHLAPKSFHGFFHRIETLPNPPEALCKTL